MRTVDQLAMKGEKRKDAEARYKADKDGFVEIVFCIEDGKAVAQQVKTGIQSDELIEILDGLKEGDEVVTGSYRAISKDLENGAMVTINNEPRRPRGRRQVGRRDRDRIGTTAANGSRSRCGTSSRPTSMGADTGARAARRLARHRAATSTWPSWDRRARASRR